MQKKNPLMIQSVGFEISILKTTQKVKVDLGGGDSDLYIGSFFFCPRRGYGNVLNKATTARPRLNLPPLFEQLPILL